MTGKSEPPELFRQAVQALHSVRPRPEVELVEVRAPQRLAPWSFAFSAEAHGPADELATGRLVLLHDPEAEDAWGGVLRVVAFVRAELDAELASDPLLSAVAWSWLTDALEGSTAHWSQLGGTVTQTSSARFGDISGPARTDDLELRASWTADDAELAAHADAFCELISSTVGLPPVGVTLFTQRQGTP
ncbi:DUF3000 domain-containing protein [Kutzneria viridogrisea]|uniref:DUF3000 domain-containing protein n=2 Tax=Kutzneria TaxID=43356 RepID=W5WH63_9PSEU|nr:DUF3000 domain-containing protein [Kutzneria albida]AHI00168.1 hypothetical protein KALB_6809 [Kutzneria albida DSM 43870]MBA8925345.1 hypothetical protein [Kutzneria viridogrisea]